MSMFETFGKAAQAAGRKENTLRKLDRMNTAPGHAEPDRVPISDFFWGGFQHNTPPWIETVKSLRPDFPVYGSIIEMNECLTRLVGQLNAARGGSYIFQSDHSVSSAVSGPTYDYIVKLVREFGTYPIHLGEFEEACS